MDFHCRVIFMCVNKVEVMYEVSRVNLYFNQVYAHKFYPLRVKLSRNFYVRTCVKFTFANKIEAMYERSLVSVEVEPRSTSCELPCLSSALFILPLFYLRD